MLNWLSSAAALAQWSSQIRNPDLDALMGGYSASVDWPASAYWPELSAANPDAIILLSSRATPEEWWTSMEKTIINVLAAASVKPWMNGSS